MCYIVLLSAVPLQAAFIHVLCSCLQGALARLRTWLSRTGDAQHVSVYDLRMAFDGRDQLSKVLQSALSVPQQPACMEDEASASSASMRGANAHAHGHGRRVPNSSIGRSSHTTGAGLGRHHTAGITAQSSRQLQGSDDCRLHNLHKDEHSILPPYLLLPPYYCGREEDATALMDLLTERAVETPSTTTTSSMESCVVGSATTCTSTTNHQLPVLQPPPTA